MLASSRIAAALAAGIGVASAAACVRGDTELRGSSPPVLDEQPSVAAVPADGDGAARSSVSPPDTAGHEEGPGAARVPLSRWQLWAAWNALKGDAYDLDGVNRFLDDGEQLACEPKSLVRYGGTRLKYQSAVQVNPAFRERLARFEDVVLEVAKDVYGRSPRRVLHFGTYACRSSRNRTYRVSEHALGNAIDVAGFDFGPASKREPLAPGLPRSLASAFQVRIAKHWSDQRTAAAATHARFLYELSTRLSEREDVFRVMIGPSRPDHADHFHFDMSPWRYVRF
jgi:hypothetical protein